MSVLPVCTPQTPAAELSKPSAEPDLAPLATGSQGKVHQKIVSLLPFLLSWSGSSRLGNRHDRDIDFAMMNFSR